MPLSNDFLQYYLGAYVHVAAASTDKDGAPAADAAGAVRHTEFALNGGDSRRQPGAHVLDGHDVEHPAARPRTRSSRPSGGPHRPAAGLRPADGQYYAVAKSNDASYKRLRRTIDLTGVTSSGDLSFKLSYDTEPDFDYVFVEAHTVGQDDWTTLPDATATRSDRRRRSRCDINWDTLHPFLAHYQTNTDKSQDAERGLHEHRHRTGAWNAATGNSGGFKDWKVDLSAVQGQAGRGLDHLRPGLRRLGPRRVRRRGPGHEGRRGRGGDVVRGRPRRLRRRPARPRAPRTTASGSARSPSATSSARASRRRTRSTGASASRASRAPSSGPRSCAPPCSTSARCSRGARTP